MRVAGARCWMNRLCIKPSRRCILNRLCRSPNRLYRIINHFLSGVPNWGRIFIAFVIRYQQAEKIAENPNWKSYFDENPDRCQSLVLVMTSSVFSASISWMTGWPEAPRSNEQNLRCQRATLPQRFPMGHFSVLVGGFHCARAHDHAISRSGHRRRDGVVQCVSFVEQTISALTCVCFVIKKYIFGKHFLWKARATVIANVYEQNMF